MHSSAVAYERSVRRKSKISEIRVFSAYENSAAKVFCAKLNVSIALMAKIAFFKFFIVALEYKINGNF